MYCIGRNSLHNKLKSKVMSASQLSPISFRNADYQFKKDSKIIYIKWGVKLAILSNVVFIVVGFFININLSLIALLLLISCLVAWLLLKKDMHEATIHCMSLSYALGFIALPWLIGPIYAPILVYIFILLVANLVFHSDTVKVLYFSVIFLSIYAYILGNINTKHPELPYIQFVEFGMLVFVMLFIANALQVFLLDIKNFKYQLREREIFLDNIINTSPNIISVKNEKRQFVLVNDKFLEIEDRPREAYIGKTLMEVHGKFEDGKRLKDEDIQILTGEKQIISNIITAILEGQKTWFDYTKVPMKDEHKNIVGILGVTKNITQKKLHEIVLQEKNEQLEKYIESNMQLENFAHIASHDLREPIRTIVSFSQLLKGKAKDKLSEDESEYLDFIITASKNMTALIDDLLSYALVNSKKPAFEDVYLAPLFEALLLQMRVAIQEKEAIITYDGLPEKIMGNPRLLTQLLQNLLSNGIKFRRPDRSPVIAIRAKDLGHYWQFSVSDNGIGISPEYHDRIFLLFRRLHTREVYEGSGIGLATCKKIVDFHQGNIWLDSQKGQGTTFHFTIHKNLESEAKIRSTISNETQ